MKSGIYKITCLTTNEIYIGASVSISDRKTNHLRELKHQNHKNYKLQSDYNKYGKDDFKFDILELCSKKELNKKEQEYVNLLKPYYNICYNVTNKTNTNLAEKREFLNMEKYKFYKVDFFGNILDTFWTFTQASEKLGMNDKAISKILKTGNYSKFGYFLTDKLDKLPLKVPKNYAGNKTILQLDENKEIINEFNCPKELKAITGISYKAVFSAIKRKGKSGGFYWQFE